MDNATALLFCIAIFIGLPVMIIVGEYFNNK